MTGALTAVRARARAQHFFSVLGEDIKRGFHDLVVNTIAGSALTPRALRYIIYKVSGIRTFTQHILPGCTFVGEASVMVAADVFVNRDCYFESVAPISIGRGSLIAMGAMIVTSSHHLDDAGKVSLQATGLPVTIGERCWICARATILPGVTIGDDVVIAAGAVVTKDCESGGMYAGVPAKRVKELSKSSMKLSHSLKPVFPRSAALEHAGFR